MTTPLEQLAAVVAQMRHKPIRNYILPGLSSYLIGDGNENGTVRMFDSARETHEYICPHSHRYDFACLVLEGSVLNTIYHPADDADTDWYVQSELTYRNIGEYTTKRIALARFKFDTTKYTAGEIYAMSRREIHSIKFSKNAKVLFFEGPSISVKTLALEPHVHGRHISLMKTEDWMFLKDEE